MYRKSSLSLNPLSLVHLNGCMPPGIMYCSVAICVLRISAMDFSIQTQSDLQISGKEDLQR